MRIADVNEFYATQGGGVKTYVEAKLAAAADAGHDLTVIAPGPESRVEPRNGGRIHWIASPPLPPDPRYYVLWNEKAVRSALDQCCPEILEGSSVWTSGWFAARYRRSDQTLKRALFFHQDAVAVYPHTMLDRFLSPSAIDASCRPFWAYLRRLSAHFDRTVVAGDWLAERLSRFGTRHPVSIPLGIDKQLFHPARRSTAVRDQLLARCGLGADGKVLVAVSRHHPEKRIGTLIRAVRRAAQTQPLGLLLIGDGPLRKWVHRKAANAPNVVVEGYFSNRDELAEVVASADGFLHGSAAETFGLVVAESIAAGTPVIVPNTGGAFDLSAPGHAETYPPGDVEACAQAIHRLLARDPQALRHACGQYREVHIGTMADHFDSLFAHYQGLTG